MLLSSNEKKNYPQSRCLHLHPFKALQFGLQDVQLVLAQKSHAGSASQMGEDHGEER